VYFDDRALGRKRVASRGFVIDPGSVCHRARICHIAWFMQKFRWQNCPALFAYLKTQAKNSA